MSRFYEIILEPRDSLQYPAYNNIISNIHKTSPEIQKRGNFR